MKTLEYVPVPAFEDNYIWLISDGQDAIVVDPGDAAPVEAYLTKRGWRLTAILLTHHHHDHVGGVAKLLVSQSAGNSADRKIPVIGHTAGHIAYFQPNDPQGTPHLFCGDTLFASGCGRLFEGTPQQMLNSLDALAALPDATLVHCAHEYTLSNIRFARAAEPDNAALAEWQKQAEQLRARNQPTIPTTLLHERQANPFLRVGEKNVQATLAAQFERPVRDRLDAFTLMRGWKDKFR